MSQYRQNYTPPPASRRLFGVDLTPARVMLALVQGAGMAAAFIAIYFLIVLASVLAE